MSQRLLPTVLAILASAVGAASAARPPIQSLSTKDLGLGLPKQETPFEPNWSVEAGAVMFHRSAGPSVPLAESAPPGQGTILNAADLEFGFEAGPYVSLSKQVTERLAGEILYFGMGGWHSRRSVALPAGITTTVFDAGSTVFDRIDAWSESQLDNVELNVVYRLSGRFDLLCGFRWVGLEDTSGVLWDGRESGADFASASVWADNQLYGLQVGFDGTLWRPSTRLYLDGLLKAGVFSNQMSIGRDAGGTMPEFSSSAREITRTSVLGELGLFGVFEVTERIALSLGYEVMWIDGVASGLSASDRHDVGTVFCHGARATIEARW